MWENNATPETHDPIARVAALLEKPKEQFFMPKKIQHENEIKAVLDHQLINLRMFNTDPIAPSHDIAGLKSIVLKRVPTRDQMRC